MHLLYVVTIVHVQARVLKVVIPVVQGKLSPNNDINRELALSVEIRGTWGEIILGFG